jgi:hypothetical protein
MVRWVDPRGIREPSKKPKDERSKITRAQAIRLQCIECMGFQVGLIKDCPDKGCPLWPYRIGRGYQDPNYPIRTKDTFSKRPWNDKKKET